MILPPRADLWTTPANEFYGHGTLVREFLGVQDHRVSICGELQHGWSVGVATPMRSRYSAACPLYVWNERSQQAAKAGGVPDDAVCIIGAPILYAQWGLVIKREPGTIVAFPQHSTPGHSFKRPRAAVEDYARWLGNLRDEAGLAGATVCLHSHEFSDLAIRRTCLQFGLKTVTCGYPIGSVDFLRDLLGLVLSAEFVTSNVVSTPLIYGALAEKVVFVDGPLPERSPPTSELGEQIYEEAADHAWVVEHFPEFTRGLDSAPDSALGQRELGVKFKQARESLWEVVNLMYAAPVGPP